LSEIREALNSAYESLSAETDSTPAPEAAPAVEASATVTDTPVVETNSTEAVVATGERARDASGKFAKAETPSSTTEKPAAVASAQTGPGDSPPIVAGAVTSPPVEPQPAQPEIKAPQSWKATVREKWSTVPAEVQQEVARREREISVAMQEASEARKFHEQFRATVAPYEMMLRAEGADPIRATASLFQTAAALRTAPPAHKAELIANMVKTYGVPLEALAAAIDGQPQAERHQAAGQQFQDPRVDQLLAQLQQQAQQRQQQALQQTQHTVEQFKAQAEFIDDVRDEMADLIEVATKRGREMSLQQAYDLACKAHPEISEVLRRREAARLTANAQASTQRSKAAASSVRSHPTSGNGAQSSDDSIRASLEAAYAQLSGR
jgi:hypothetical protein